MMNKMDGKFTFSNEFMTKIKEEKKLGNNVFTVPCSAWCMAWKRMFLDFNDEGSLTENQ